MDERSIGIKFENYRCAGYHTKIKTENDIQYVDTNNEEVFDVSKFTIETECKVYESYDELHDSGIKTIDNPATQIKNEIDIEYDDLEQKIIAAGRANSYNDQNIFECKECGKSFFNEKRFMGHVENHTENPRKCTKCGKCFLSMSNLELHMQVHTLPEMKQKYKQNPYKCDICFKYLRSKNTLEDHVKIHTGERHFKCDVCQKSFVKSCTLKVHKAVHDVEKPYKCDICSSSFLTNSKLTKHKLRHTGNN